jgi:hypothetical protein
MVSIGALRMVLIAAGRSGIIVWSDLFRSGLRAFYIVESETRLSRPA